MPRTAIVEGLQRCEKTFLLERPGGLVQRRQAELAFEGAAARGLDIDEAARDVLVRVFSVRQRDVGERRLQAGEHLLRRRPAGEDVGAEFRKGHVAPAGDHVIGQRTDALIRGFVADLGAADNHRHLRRDALEDGDHARGVLDVPDVDAETDDARGVGQQPLGDVGRAVAEHEFADAARLAQRAQVRAQAAQAQRGVHMAGVEGGEGDAGHGRIIALQMTAPGRF